MENISTSGKAKITILSGFLGSGKTTMIENLLKEPVLSKKIAVIQNEFSSGKSPFP
jgi:G3E family GTPase